MRICHFAPFGPGRCGQYEAARDMAVADLLSGHEVYFVDTGVQPVGGERQEPVAGSVDHRGKLALHSDPPEVALKADVLVMHTGVPDIWIVGSQAPIVWVIHSRPAAAFRSEQAGGLGRSFQLVQQLAAWPRVKAMLYFWPEYKPYWSPFIPPAKHLCLDFPPIDRERFSPEGPVHVPGSEWTSARKPGLFERLSSTFRRAPVLPSKRGKWNGLICDSWRDDIDVFEVAVGAIEAARRVPGLKWHFYALQPDVRGGSVKANPNYGRTMACWEMLLEELRKLDALGEVCSRMTRIEEAYRGMDFVLTPHRIVTRVIGEALSCGTPVVAQRGCRVATVECDYDDPLSVAEAVVTMVLRLEVDRQAVKFQCLRAAEKFDLGRYSATMDQLYKKISGL